MNGHFITFEGGEGAGKTSILPFVAANLSKLGHDVLTTREPGGIEIAEKIRHIILDPVNTKMDGRTEALLYAAARRQHLVEKVLPALKKGKIVLCDRFVDSSLAYQGYARGIGMEEVFTINQFAIQNCMPNLTLFFDIEPKKGLQRIAANKDREKNRLDLETIQFHEQVYEAYKIVERKFQDRFKTINAEQSFERVESDATNAIVSYLEKTKS
ncbi:dTMP kinase [Virgibacillus oceani]|uniref:Thymidylate kinase n=1 Tax=Virgibacillus oceani TaxID=1479511 RepID=A0A917M7E2_9BACI|nr:dTMP kinase [Virgibacillus oceani]GGG82303.1 thymidylate kinase [Virgibacillus oceani]